EICGVNNYSNLNMELIEDCKLIPVVSPAFYSIRILVVPFFSKVLYSGLCSTFGGGFIDIFHIIGKLLLILPYHVFSGITDLVYYTNLCFRLWENIFDGIGKTVEIIGCSNQ